MPPGSSQKGTGKKNSAAIQKQSRNTTPAPVATASLPPQDVYDPDYLNTRVILFRNLTYDDMVDQSASNATIPDSKTGEMAESNMAADRDEDFNTRYGSFRGSQLALERVKPIPRDTAQVHLAKMVLAENLKNTTQVVDYLIARFMRVPPSDAVRHELVAFLDHELGTSDIAAASTYLEEPLRLVLHLIMSQPEYQLS